MSTRIRIAILALSIALVCPVATQAQSRRVAPRLAAQLRMLEREKATRTATERKISSRLLFRARWRRGREPVPGMPQIRPRRMRADGMARVDVRATESRRVLARIEALGGRVLGVHGRRGSIRAEVPVDALESLAALPEVRRIRSAAQAFTRKVDTSEGDVAHRADQTRAAFVADGAGTTIGVMSDGVDSLAARQATGDLPSTVSVLPGEAGSGDEGTAMLEIVYDLAPGADLVFATAFSGEQSFADNIRGLRDAGADVIVDDVGYFAEPVFQDGVIAEAVDEVAGDGVLYFSSAGNGGRVDAGTGGVWEGDFVDSGSTQTGSPIHDYGGGVLGNTIVDDSPFVFGLQWSDPQGGSGNDYDLLLVDADFTTVLAASTDLQNGNDDPIELIDSFLFDDTGLLLVVVRAPNADGRYLHLDAFRGELAPATEGATAGHPGARGALGVAAVFAGSAGGAGGEFDGSEPVESFSSDGPRRVFYEADGTQITPGDVSSTGGELRAKPDLAGADGVSTSTPGFSTFFGTSAAAPHAAAAAGLLLEIAQRGGKGPDDVRDALLGTALDLAPAGHDRNSGAGVFDLLAASETLAPECSDGLDNDGDGFFDTLDVGCADAQDPSERSASLVCDNGEDDDGDGLVDYPNDPGCRGPIFELEDPECQNGLDDDNADGRDFDGGLSATGMLDPAGADPKCVNAWDLQEAQAPSNRGCGLGAEIGPLLAALFARRLGRRRT